MATKKKDHDDDLVLGTGAKGDVHNPGKTYGTTEDAPAPQLGEDGADGTTAGPVVTNDASTTTAG